MNPDHANKKLTVILPCAGSGSRLGLKTPKELYEISTGKGLNWKKPVKLIDFSLQHIRAFPAKGRLKVAVVIQPWKKDVSQYVVAQLPGIEVETVIFNENYLEWPGSVLSARNAFSDFNVVLLPDSYLSLSQKGTLTDVTTINSSGRSLLNLMQERLTQHEVVFAAIPCDDPVILKSMGAMRVQKGWVTQFQDKPQLAIDSYDSQTSFNAFWGCYGFRKDTAEALYEFLIASVHHQKVSLKEQIFYPPGTISLPTYYDLGTWERINKLIG